MSPSESPASGSPGRRRKTRESGLAEEAAAERAAPRRGGSRRKDGRGPNSGRRRQEPKRFGRTLTLLLAALGAAVLALAAVLSLQFLGGGDSEGAVQQARPEAYKVIDAGNMNEVLALREVDNRPLNEGEMFTRGNEEISSQDLVFTLQESTLTEDCAEAVWGEAVQAALAEAGCTQAAMGAYTAEEHLGVAVIFNLEDVDASRAVARAMEEPEEEDGTEADDPGFLVPNTAQEPFDRLGQGYSAGEAVVSGHYLVVAWVQRTDSESAQDRASLAAPLVALGNFRDPLYRRMVELGDGSAGQPAQGTAEEGTAEEEGVLDSPEAGGA